MPLTRVETAAKERLTGALLVVLALVIVIPELLSGRSNGDKGTPPAQNPEEGAPLQTYDMQLDGSASAPAAPRDVPAAAAAEITAVPPPVTNTEAPAMKNTEAPPATPTPPVAVSAPPAQKPANPGAANGDQPPASESARAAEPATQATPAAASGKWWVQLGSFASRDNAQQLATKLRNAGFSIDVSQGSGKGKELYRVRAGPAADRDAASALQARLAAAGEKKSSLIAP